MGGAFNYSYYNVIGWNKSGGYVQLTDHILSDTVTECGNDYILFLKFDNHTSFVIPDLNELITSLNHLYQKVNSPFIILTPRMSAPLYAASEDEYVFSFSCKVSLYKKLSQNQKFREKLSSTQLLFELFNELITDKIDHEDILIRQIPISGNYEASSTRADVIIPHKGNTDYLKKTLTCLAHVDHLSIYVGIDQTVSKDLQLIMDQFPQVSFYYFEPNPVGPYVIRNRLIERSDQDLLFFQDSDDISCIDRFEMISNYMAFNNCELCGSHELRLDYYNRTIQSVRYPIDVNHALKSGAWHALLHPASAITRRAFYDREKLSEERIFANDTKFLLNCYFNIRNISNIDEFLYIRRKHPDSLTNLEATRIGSPIRHELLRSWNTDFELIKMGLLELKASSLVFIPTSLQFNILEATKTSQ